MNGWINLNRADIDATVVSRDGDGNPPRRVELLVSLSPYDVPDAIRGYYHQGRQRFTIEFRYISEERTRPIERGDITFWIGRDSERLYAIDIDVDAVGATSVALALKQAVRDVSEHPFRHGREGNYRAVEEVLGGEAAAPILELLAS